MFIRLLHIFLIITVIQVITNGEILPNETKNISIYSNHTHEESKSNHQSDERSESEQEEVEGRNLASEGLLGLDLFLTHNGALLSNITNYNHKIYNFFKPELNTPPPEGFKFI